MRTVIENNYLEMLGILPALICLLLLVMIIRLDHYIRPEFRKPSGT